MKKNIAILGSTGSIGTQALEVIDNHPEHFSVEVLTAHNNVDLLIRQAIKYQPNAVVISNETHYSYLSEQLNRFDIKVFAGRQSLEEVVAFDTVDMVLVALVGFAGLLPTLHAIQHGKAIAIANKETLVVAGEMVTRLAAKHQVSLLPVDSEHSAIFQCLVGEHFNPIEKLILTASGGPFLGKSVEDLTQVTRQQALKHPNWSMGNKITIDSATMMNKGLEVIEAKWLFNVAPEEIDIVVHPQSIIHSLVQFRDGSIKAQLGLPDMKLPIQYALSYPYRMENTFKRFDFADFSSFDFYPPDRKTFKTIDLAYQAIEEGGNMPCVLNAANEVAVEAFLQEKTSFLSIADIIGETMQQIKCHSYHDIEELVETDAEARQKAKELINHKK